MLATIVASVTTILTFAGIFYYIAVLWSARSFIRRRTPQTGFAPGVSILKPVKGLDPGMYEAFASHCRQEYSGEYELLFGVSSLADPNEAPVIAAIERLKAEFPEHAVRLIETPERLGPNGKMGNVVQLARHARYNYVIVNDSDIRVGPTYLARIMGEFGKQGSGNRDQGTGSRGSENSSPLKPTEGLSGAPWGTGNREQGSGINSTLKPTEGLNRPPWGTGNREQGSGISSTLKPTEGLSGAPTKKVGLVTAPYRGQAHPTSENPDVGHPKSSPTLGSRLEALGISTDFFAGVLVALKMDGEIRFGLGSTLAVSKTALDASGGFEPLVDALADDYELGRRIADAGYTVALSREIVDTSVPAYTLDGYFAHQLRWARAIRDSRRAGYVGLMFTYGLPWALLNCLASGFAIESLALLSLTLLARMTVALGVGVGILGDRQVLRDLWLVPLRDLTAMAVWVWSFAGNTVTWRGESFRLDRGVLKNSEQGRGNRD